MKLKAVEMQGFKSFPDRTKLTFDDGITVIVGPNGSGKSNISDAIKWVFGEQSVKSLRGAKMEDVIFGGSISRKPTGFAWVSLFIDNTDRSIDIDSDEVVITRRLYRSGESEYRINNNPVRLRDINEMFMDTGLGRDGYSVIEQGKIAEIVSAKSTQRREIFEEAAGISRFRYRKTEAERKLQQAEDNLVRLRDIMQELEDRVGPLKAQSEKAKQYVVLAGEKKSLEISLWLEQLAKLGRQLAELEDKTLLAANDRTTAQRRLDEIERELEEIQHKTQDANLYIEHKRERIKEFEDAISNAKVEAAVKQNTIDHNNDTIAELENETGLDREAALADMRFTFIERLCDKTVVRPGESREHKRSVAMDKVLTGKYTALPCFIGIMALVFWLTFGVIGAALSDLLTLGIDAVTNAADHALTAYGINPVVHSLVIDGIFAGVGSVLSFLPVIVTLFFFLSILEDTGYMARVAFVMDQLLRRVGLSGRSFVPMLIGFGCSVPAIMATRTLSSDRDRKMTILLTPFMSCSAKLPIYALFTTAFFPRQWRAVVMVGLYLTGIVCGILYALVLKLTRYKGEPVPFVMELPNYRFPSARSVGQLIWEKAKDFLQKAFTIIFVATVLIWFLQTFDTRLNVAAPDTSLLALIGSWVAPIFKPLGFGDWRVSTALITGFTAKESVVSTLTVLLGGDTAALSTMFTPFTAVVFLVFTLLYTPCVAAVAAAKRELGSAKAAAGVVVMQCGIAWVVAFVVHCIGTLLGFV